MATIQGNRMVGQGHEQGDFAALLRDHAHAAGLTYEELAEAAGLPLDTLLNWTKGRVRRPRSWRDVAQVGRALHLSAVEADALFRAATHPALALLKQAHPDDALLADWSSAALEAHSIAQRQELPTMPLPSIMPMPGPTVAVAEPMPTHPQPAPLRLAEEQRALIPARATAAPLAADAPAQAVHPALRPPTVHRTERLMAGAGFILGLLVAIIALAMALNQSAAPLPVIANWSVVGPIELAPVSVAPDGRIYIMVGQWVTATLHLHNDSDATNFLPQLGLGGRGPDGCEKNWNGQDANFPGINQISVPPSGTYIYQTSRVFTQPGVYFAEPVWGNGQGHGGGIAPYPRIWFTVTADPNHLPPRDCLTPVPTPFTLGWEWGHK